MTDRPMPRKDANGRFVAGSSGNPMGRPKGSRNKIAEAFLTALQADFAEHGKVAIENMRTDKPAEYIKVIAGLLPKEMALRRPEQELTDGELAEMLDALKRIDRASDSDLDDESEDHSPHHDGITH